MKKNTLWYPALLFYSAVAMNRNKPHSNCAQISKRGMPRSTCLNLLSNTGSAARQATVIHRLEHATTDKKNEGVVTLVAARVPVSTIHSRGYSAQDQSQGGRTELTDQVEAPPPHNWVTQGPLDRDVGDEKISTRHGLALSPLPNDDRIASNRRLYIPMREKNFIRVKTVSTAPSTVNMRRSTSDPVFLSSGPTEQEQRKKVIEKREKANDYETFVRDWYKNP